MKISKILGMLLVIVLITSLSLIGVGCKEEVASEEMTEESTEEEATTEEMAEESPSEEEMEEVSLRWAVISFYPGEEDAIQKLVDLYRIDHPNVNVEIETYSTDEYNQKLTTQLAGSDMPDIITNWGGNVAALAKEGLTMDLTPYLQSGDYEFTDKDIHPVMLRVATIHTGEVMFLPKEASGLNYLYNKDMFDEAGLDYPTEDWTYDDMVEMAKALTKETDDGMQYGITSHPYWMYAIIAAAGAYGFDGGSLNENHEYNFNTPEAVEGIGKFFDGFKEGYSMPVSTLDEFGGDLAAFGLGKGAFLPTFRWGVPKVRELAEFDWDVQLAPLGPTGKHYAFCGTSGYSISSGCKNIDVAVDLIFSLYSEEGFREFASSYAVVPPVTSLFDSDIWRGLDPPPYNNDVYVKLLDDAVTTPMIPEFRQTFVNKGLQDALDNYLLNDMSLQDSLDLAVADVNAQIAELVEEYGIE